MAKIKNKDFFRTGNGTCAAPEDNKAAGPAPCCDTPSPVKVPRELLDTVAESAKALQEAGLKAEAAAVADLCIRLQKEKFTVAMVGEFSTGKSTMINRLLGRPGLMPTADLPTTALACKITYGPEEGIMVFGRNGKDQRRLPLAPESWKGLTADNDGGAPADGGVLVTLPDRWLAANGLEIVDTPGAGDLDSDRIKVTERAILNSDATVVAISALKPLSLTEQAFIRQKIAATRVPYVAIALTRLDQIPRDERAQAVDFVFKKLEALKLSVPVVIPDDVETGETRYTPLCGVACLRRLIETWAADPARSALTATWLRANAAAITRQGLELLSQQRALLETRDVEREKLIADKTTALAKVADKWEALRDEMNRRCAECCAKFNTKAEELGAAVTENLQHEADRQADVRRWLEKDYAYRVKRELNAACITLNNYVSATMANDLRWLNNRLSAQFKAMLGTSPEAVAFKDDFSADVNDKTIRLDDLGKKQVRATIVSMAASIGTALALAGAGPGLAILGTMGVGGGGNLLVRQIFSKKAAEQRAEVVRLIAADIPRIITASTADSLVKIKLAYHNIITDSQSAERRWMQSQRELIRKANAAPAADTEGLAAITRHTDALTALANRLDAGAK